MHNAFNDTAMNDVSQESCNSHGMSWYTWRSRAEATDHSTLVDYNIGDMDRQGLSWKFTTRSVS